MSDEKAPNANETSKRKRRRRRKAPGEGDATRSTPADNAPQGDGAKANQAAPSRPQGSRRRRGGKGGSPPDKGRADKGRADKGRSDKGSPAQSSHRPARESAEGEKDSRAARPRRERGREESNRGRGAPSQDRPSSAPTTTSVPRRASQESEASPPVPVQERVRWGDDDDAPTKEISALPPDLPANASGSDWDPTSAELISQGGEVGDLSARICNVIGVRFATAGRLYLYDGGEGNYERGDRVVVEAERGERIATVGAQSSRQPPARSLKRVLRRAGADEVGKLQGDQQQAHLAKAKALAKEMALPIKVFRASLEHGGRLAIYYSCDDKTDVRRLTRALSDSLPMPVELRHHGVRDEAKLVGGIGSCGLELCCTTWLPAFVPVSIKNAKDQGLVLNPTKVSGQCGRLKCCLVYEQAQYAEMRKGLPKLGKRVVTNDGFEGRVIEVDVLHQRFRVSIGRGESKVYQKGEVEPMFASQAQSVDSGDQGQTEEKDD